MALVRIHFFAPLRCAPICLLEQTTAIEKEVRGLFPVCCFPVLLKQIASCAETWEFLLQIDILDIQTDPLYGNSGRIVHNPCSHHRRRRASVDPCPSQFTT